LVDLFDERHGIASCLRLPTNAQAADARASLPNVPPGHAGRLKAVIIIDARQKTTTWLPLFFRNFLDDAKARRRPHFADSAHPCPVAAHKNDRRR
jgi:hypothetical protein